MPSCSCYRRVDLRQCPDLCCFCVARGSPDQPSRQCPQLAPAARPAEDRPQPGPADPADHSGCRSYGHDRGLHTVTSNVWETAQSYAYRLLRPHLRNGISHVDWRVWQAKHASLRSARSGLPGSLLVTRLQMGPFCAPRADPADGIVPTHIGGYLKSPAKSASGQGSAAVTCRRRTVRVRRETSRAAARRGQSQVTWVTSLPVWRRHRCR
jgi:hypothetical protein